MHIIKIASLASLASLSLISAASASVTLTFTTIANKAIAENNTATGSGVNGIYWGIVVDVDGNGFSGDGALANKVYEGGFSFDLSQNHTELNNTDDVIFMASTTTNTSFGVSGTMTGIASIELLNLTVNSIPNVNLTNKNFGLIWFDNSAGQVQAPGLVQNGTFYGFAAGSSTMNTGGDGDTTNFSSRFSGSTAMTANLQLIPEPSSTALLGLGSVALLLRRRR
jgi:hypothetical protein